MDAKVFKDRLLCLSCRLLAGDGWCERPQAVQDSIQQTSGKSLSLSTTIVNGKAQTERPLRTAGSVVQLFDCEARTRIHLNAIATSLSFRTKKKVTEGDTLSWQREQLSRAVYTTDSWRQRTQTKFALGEKLRT